MHERVIADVGLHEAVTGRHLARLGGGEVTRIVKLVDIEDPIPPR